MVKSELIDVKDFCLKKSKDIRTGTGLYSNVVNASAILSSYEVGIESTDPCIKKITTRNMLRSATTVWGLWALSEKQIYSEFISSNIRKEFLNYQNNINELLLYNGTQYKSFINYIIQSDGDSLKSNIEKNSFSFSDESFSIFLKKSDWIRTGIEEIKSQNISLIAFSSLWKSPKSMVSDLLLYIVNYKSGIIFHCNQAILTLSKTSINSLPCISAYPSFYRASLQVTDNCPIVNRAVHHLFSFVKRWCILTQLEESFANSIHNTENTLKIIEAFGLSSDIFSPESSTQYICDWIENYYSSTKEDLYIPDLFLDILEETDDPEIRLFIMTLALQEDLLQEKINMIQLTSEKHKIKKLSNSWQKVNSIIKRQKILKTSSSFLINTQNNPKISTIIPEISYKNYSFSTNKNLYESCPTNNKEINLKSISCKNDYEKEIEVDNSNLMESMTFVSEESSDIDETDYHKDQLDLRSMISACNNIINILSSLGHAGSYLNKLSNTKSLDIQVNELLSSDWLNSSTGAKHLILNKFKDHEVLYGSLIADYKVTKITIESIQDMNFINLLGLTLQIQKTSLYFKSLILLKIKVHEKKLITSWIARGLSIKPKCDLKRIVSISNNITTDIRNILNQFLLDSEEGLFHKRKRVFPLILSLHSKFSVLSFICDLENVKFNKPYFRVIFQFIWDKVCNVAKNFDLVSPQSQIHLPSIKAYINIKPSQDIYFRNISKLLENLNRNQLTKSELLSLYTYLERLVRYAKKPNVIQNIDTLLNSLQETFLGHSMALSIALNQILPSYNLLIGI